MIAVTLLNEFDPFNAIHLSQSNEQKDDGYEADHIENHHQAVEND